MHEKWHQPHTFGNVPLVESVTIHKDRLAALERVAEDARVVTSLTGTIPWDQVIVKEGAGRCEMDLTWGYLHQGLADALASLDGSEHERSAAGEGLRVREATQPCDRYREMLEDIREACEESGRKSKGSDRVAWLAIAAMIAEVLRVEPKEAE